MFCFVDIRYPLVHLFDISSNLFGSYDLLDIYMFEILKRSCNLFKTEVEKKEINEELTQLRSFLSDQ